MPDLIDVERSPLSGSNFVHLPENAVVAPLKRLADSAFFVVWATWMAEDSVVTPHSSVVYSGTDVVNAVA